MRPSAWCPPLIAAACSLLVPFALPGCARVPLTGNELSDPSRLSVGYLEAAPLVAMAGSDAPTGGAIYVSKPLWLARSSYMQAGLRASAMIGMTGTVAGLSATSLDVGFDLGAGSLVALRWSLGPYVGTHYINRQTRAYAGLHMDLGWSVGIGSDPRSRLLMLVNEYIPLNDEGGWDSCPQGEDLTRCGVVIGFTIALEGMFL